VRIVRALIVAVLLLGGLAPVATAANNESCATSFARYSVGAATSYIWPHILFPAAFDDDPANLMTALAGDDADGNGFVCIKTQWGEALNPNSHYALLGNALIGEPTWSFVVHDDRANASN